MKNMLLLLVLILITVSHAQTPSQVLHELFREDWEFQLKENPLWATRIGDHRFDDRLPSVTLEDYARRAEHNREMLQRLNEIDYQALPEPDKINYDIFKWQKESALEEYRFKTYLMPITQRSGFHVSFPQLPDITPFKTVSDYKNYISRLRQFKRYVEQHIALMREGIRQGMVPPAIILKDIDKIVAAHVVDKPEYSTLYKPFKQFPDYFQQAEKDSLQKEGRRVIKTVVIPAFQQLVNFLREEYIPAGRSSIAARDLPEGKAFYEFRVRYFTTLPISPEEVHAIGLREVKRIRAEMETLIRQTGFEGDFHAFIHFLRTSPQFYVDSPEALLKEVAYVLKRMDGELPRLFKQLPRMPYGIKPVPDFIAPRTTTAYYQRPAGDGTRAGNYFVNTYDLKSRPLYEIEALSFHEAVPGHHLQLALQQELTNLPPFRRFGGFTVFVEGWALYAERLGLEVGFYQDPYSNFGRLTYEMWRACRLVVDTGMHYLGWSRQQAIDFMAENTALTLLNITNEVDRYISWPGQALAYKMGELEIRRLRQEAETRLGTSFDLREFHQVVLEEGAIPLQVLQQRVEKWIRTKQN